MSERTVSRSCEATEHDRCKGKTVAEGTMGILARCACACHSVAATTYVTRDGRTISLSAVKP
jgi:hypothetical protein